MGQEKVHHETNDFTGGKVLPRIFVQGFIELPNQFLEDIAHLQVRDDIRMQVDIFETFHHEEQQSCLIELADSILKVKLFQHLSHVLGEAGDVRT